MSRAVVDPESRLAAFVADLDFEDVPESAVERITRAVGDTVGVTLAGTTEPAGANAFGQVGMGGPLGLDSNAGAAEVGLALGTAGHALDYDDLSWAIDGHPSVVLVPAILALADGTDASGRDAIAAYAAGFEVMAAIAAPISPDHYEAGWHATATFGVFGAAGAAAWLLDLDADEAHRALCIAASTPAGLKRNFGSMTKPLHAGLAARSGLTAALFARDGLTADRGAISAEGGFWELYGDGADEQVTIGEDWTLRERGIHTKAYPCCYFTHAAIAAAGSLSSEHGIDPETIDSVSVTASRGAADALAHADPETGLEAKFSMEYTVASAIVRDRVDLATFEEPALSDPTIERVRTRVSFGTDPDRPYDAHGATVRVEADGERFEQDRADPPGTHDDPLSEPDRRAKFVDCATRVLSKPQAKRLDEELQELPAVSSLSSLLDFSETA